MSSWGMIHGMSIRGASLVTAMVTATAPVVITAAVMVPGAVIFASPFAVSVLRGAMAAIMPLGIVIMVIAVLILVAMVIVT